MKINLLPYSNVMSDIAERIERDLVAFMAYAGKAYLDLQPKTGQDSIFAIVFDEERSEYHEEEIVAIHAAFGGNDHTHIEILTQPISTTTNVHWSIEDIAESWRKNDNSCGTWNPLFGGDISSIATAYNIADALDYVEL